MNLHPQISYYHKLSLCLCLVSQWLFQNYLPSLPMKMINQIFHFNHLVDHHFPWILHIIAIWIIIISIISIITTLNSKFKWFCVCTSSPNSHQFIEELINNFSTSWPGSSCDSLSKILANVFHFFDNSISTSYHEFFLLFPNRFYVFVLIYVTWTGPNIFTSTSW